MKSAPVGNPRLPVAVSPPWLLRRERVGVVTFVDVVRTTNRKQAGLEFVRGKFRASRPHNGEKGLALTA